MNFDKVTLSTLFNDYKNLAVPTYQRGYAWTKQEWEDFWNDLNEVIDENEDDHFLGQIVTNKLDGYEYIVDGQQRITTATIFLAVLRNAFKAVGDPRADMRGDDIQKKFIYSKGNYHFKQVDSVNEFFQELVQRASTDVAEVKKQATQESEKNFVKAFDYLEKKVNEQVMQYTTVSDKVEYLELLQDAFLDQMFIMKISTPDEASAFVIFETLNARGRDLNSSDLLKNHLFRMAKGDEEVQLLWDSMMDPLDFDSNKATRFIRSYWNGTHEFVTEKQLYRAMSRSIKTAHDAKAFVTKLEALSDDFASLVDPKNQIAFSDPRVVDNLQILNMLGAKTFYPLILVMAEKLVDGHFSEYDIAIVLHKIISFTIRNFTIGGLVANKYEKSFSTIARKLSSGTITTVNEINDLIAAEMVDDLVFRNDIQTAKISTEKAARYVLYELAYANEQGKVVLDESTVTYLNENVEDKERIGNKVLVTKNEGKEFKKTLSKKPLVFESAKYDNTRVLQGQLNVMTSEEITARQSAWANLATEIWAK